MAIHLRNFAGEQPRLNPRRLPDQNAALATNVRLTRGDLDPIREGVAVFTAPSPCEFVYKNGSEWLTFTDPFTRVVPGPVATERLYISSRTDVPRMRAGATTYPLALPAPTTPPVLSRSGTLDEDAKDLVLYCYTWLTSFGEESQPSPPAGIYWSAGNSIAVGQMQALPPGRGIAKKRVYRSVTTVTGETEFFFVAEINGSDVSYSHNLENAPMQEAMTSRDFDPPPGDFRGLVAMPNGMMAAFTGSEVLFSEPYKPHAWPAKYRLAVTDKIVALAAFGSSVAILTTGTPWVAQGLHPEQMAMERSEMPFPCLTARGVVDMGYSAIYPSTDGLVEISQSGAKLLSIMLWSRAEWENMAPTSFRAAQFSGRYVFSYTPTGEDPQIGFVDTRGDAPFFCRSDLKSPALISDLASGDLFYLTEDKTGVVEFDPSTLTAPRRAYLWRSKPFYAGRPMALGAIYVEAPIVTAGSVVRVYGDEKLLATIPHQQFNSASRLPAGRWNEVWIEAAGTSTITRISLGQMPDEVRV